MRGVGVGVRAAYVAEGMEGVGVGMRGVGVGVRGSGVGMRGVGVGVRVRVEAALALQGRPGTAGLGTHPAAPAQAAIQQGCWQRC